VGASTRTLFLIVTAVVEIGTGLCLLVQPAAVFAVLLGIEPEADTLLVGRLAGGALLAIGVACWITRADAATRATYGLLTGVFVYNVIASMLLAFAGLVLQKRGILLWPAFALHAFLTTWCFSCLYRDRASGGLRTDGRPPHRA
jgi:hypothetical protein